MNCIKQYTVIFFQSGATISNSWPLSECVCVLVLTAPALWAVGERHPVEPGCSPVGLIGSEPNKSLARDLAGCFVFLLFFSLGALLPDFEPLNRVANQQGSTSSSEPGKEINLSAKTKVKGSICWLAPPTTLKSP